MRSDRGAVAPVGVCSFALLDHGLIETVETSGWPTLQSCTAGGPRRLRNAVDPALTGGGTG
ncbi:MAG: hypothetical protein ABR585_14665, partial [Gemmatimonadaceae bacterium]